MRHVCLLRPLRSLRPTLCAVSPPCLRRTLCLRSPLRGPKSPRRAPSEPLASLRGTSGEPASRRGFRGWPPEMRWGGPARCGHAAQPHAPS
eukprot:1635745-Alexandrium_andersonii.AAC.1